MREPTDNNLHEWVRQMLDPYRPDYDPADWERLRPRLHPRPRRRWLVGLLAVFLFGALTIGGFWLTNRQEIAQQPPAQKRSFMPETNPKKTHSDILIAANRPPTMPRKRSGKPVRTPSAMPVLEPVFTTEPIRLHAIGPFTDPFLRPTSPAVSIPSPTELAIQQQLLGGFFGPDSTSYRVLDRNSLSWPNAAIVCDFTTSMYPYSTQLFAWLNRNAQNPAIRATVFFTDCDSLGQETRPGGRPGQMFVSAERDPTRVLPVLLEVARNTRNNAHEAENDIEALLFAQQRFPEAEHLILVADIDNPVKDMALLDQVRKPVHVVLCGRDWDSTQAFHPDYFTIARQTRGSLHTLTDDIAPDQLTSDTWLRVGHRFYRYHRHREQFVLTRFQHRPKRFLGLFWR
ncbi:hypothetical protein ACO2Q8_24860 [Larkinella sp. VNQ87]|uniref:hypothetical protein n=1 Tax=Larkinella sp. VNQ87 TaxID=3400921 RepID=UPI003C0FFE85